MLEKFYSINEEKKTVASWMQNELTIVDEIEQKFNRKYKTTLYTLIGAMEMRLPGNTYFKAKATCEDGDDFDQSKGIDIAGAKTDLKYHTYMAKQYSHLIAKLADIVEELDKLRDVHVTKLRNIEEDMDKFYH